MLLETFDDFKPEDKPMDELNYKDPEFFEDVEGINISMTEQRKAVKVTVGSEEIELDKDQTMKIIEALQNAIRIMM